MNKNGVNVLLVEDHPVVREHMKRKLVKMPAIAVINEAENGAAALDLAMRENYHVVLLDISLPDKSGLEILTIIRNKKPRLPVLMFSMYPEIPYALQTIKTGAAGYLYKETALEHLMNAIEQVIKGGVYISPHLAQYLESLFASDPIRTLQEVFSERELHVFRSLARGISVSQVAREMQLSHDEVEQMRLRIFAITDTSNESELNDYLTRTSLRN